MPEPSESIQPIIGSLPTRPNVRPVAQELSGGGAYNNLIQKAPGLLAFWQVDPFCGHKQTAPGISSLHQWR